MKEDQENLGQICRMRWLDQGLSVLVLEKQYVAFSFNERTLREGPPQRIQRRLLGIEINIAF